MLNDMDSLQDYGIEGAAETEPETVLCLFIWVNGL